MPYVTVTTDVFVDSKDLDLESFDTESLAKELARRSDGEKAFFAARSGRDDSPIYNLECDVAVLLDKASIGRPITEDLRDIAWHHFGRCLA